MTPAYDTSCVGQWWAVWADVLAMVRRTAPELHWLDGGWLRVRITAYQAPRQRKSGRTGKTYRTVPRWLCEGLPSPWGGIADTPGVRWRRLDETPKTPRPQRAKGAECER